MQYNVPELNDYDYLNYTISALEILSTAAPDQLIGIKDTESKHVYCSQSFADLVGLPREKIIGQSNCVPYRDELMIEMAIEEDKNIIKTRKGYASLKIINLTDGLKPRVFIKHALINPTTNNVVGILFQTFEWGITTNFTQQIIQLYNAFDHEERTIADKMAYNLTKRERQVVFFFLARLSSQEIADTLFKLDGKKIAKSTIDSIFTEQLYKKFNVTNRPALYSKLVEFGYNRLIPQEVLVSSIVPLATSRVY